MNEGAGEVQDGLGRVAGAGLQARGDRRCVCAWIQCPGGGRAGYARLRLQMAHCGQYQWPPPACQRWMEMWMVEYRIH